MVKTQKDCSQNIQRRKFLRRSKLLLYQKKLQWKIHKLSKRVLIRSVIVISDKLDGMRWICVSLNYLKDLGLSIHDIILCFRVLNIPSIFWKMNGIFDEFLKWNVVEFSSRWEIHRHSNSSNVSMYILSSKLQRIQPP